jgi:hypothetical protein
MVSQFPANCAAAAPGSFAFTPTARVTPRRPSLLHILFLISVFFPYIQLVPIGTDVQPTALCLSLLIMLSERQWTRAPIHLWLLGCMLLIALGVFAIGDFDFTALRSIGNYASVFFISLAAYSCANRVNLAIPRVLGFATYTWLLVALGQTIYSTDFLYFLLPAIRRTDSRGVVSLSPEPGFYATMCLFILLVLFLYKRELSIQGLLGVVQISLLARSTLITVILLIVLLIYAATHLTTRKSWAVAVLLFGGWIVATQTTFFANTRMNDLTQLAITSPLRMTQIDSSMSDRVGQLVFSLKGAFDNYLLPNGFTSWGVYYRSEILKAGNYFRMYYGGPYPKRIQSGIGAAFYELGAFGFILPWVLIAAIKNRFGSLRCKDALVFGSGIGLTLLPGTPIATPVYGFLIGYLFAFRRTNLPSVAPVPQH